MALSVLRCRYFCSFKKVLPRNIGVLEDSTFILHTKKLCTFFAFASFQENKLIQKFNSPYIVAGIKHYSGSSEYKQRNESGLSDYDYDKELDNLNIFQRKIRIFHFILNVKREMLISFGDFEIFTKRLTDVGLLKPEVSSEFLNELKLIWEEAFGEVTSYNLITTEQVLYLLTHEAMMKNISKRLRDLFQAVTQDHNGHLNVWCYKLFCLFCLGLSDEDVVVINHIILTLIPLVIKRILLACRDERNGTSIKKKNESLKNEQNNSTM